MIRRVSSAKGRQTTGLFSIEGTRLVERALRAGAPLQSVVISQTFSASPDPRARRLIAEIDAHGAAVVIAPDAILSELTEGRDLGAILGLVRQPEPPALERLLAESPGSHIFLAGVDILDPGNAGALVRTAHASGAKAFLAAGVTDAYHPRATRISRGSIFRIPVVSFPSPADLLDELRRLMVQTIATAAAGGAALPVFATDPQRAAVAVLMGNEGEGLPATIQSAVDAIVTIPMPAGVDSFAVNAAAAIVLYELRRANWLADAAAKDESHEPV